MPTYQYRCEACEHEFEQFQSITAEALRKCPGCKRLKLKRLIGAGAGVIFKGGGFYQTDYRSESYKKGAEADKPKSANSADDSGGAPPKSAQRTEKTEKKSAPQKKQTKSDPSSSASKSA